jgi:hypothetical protein
MGYELKEIDELKKKCILLRKKIKESVLSLSEYACLCADSDEAAEDVSDTNNLDDK